MDAKISVIVPLYNAEKYIAECLDSLLAQTFTDFEVIVVDDCSTDSSAAIVESYASKFNGRLTFTRLKKNSGNAGYSARNRGFNCSRGEYVFFVDADDTLTKTALEQLYTVAKKFDADVVYTGARYRFTSEGGAKLTLDKIGRECQARNIEDKPTFTLNDPHKSLHELLIKSRIFWTPWTKFVKRDFLTSEGITFYEIPSGGDYVWTIELFACAERFLRIPDAVYVWRDDSAKSMTRDKRPVDKQIGTWCNVFVHIARAIADLFDRNELLNQNPHYRYRALEIHLDTCMKLNQAARFQVKPEQLFEILRGKFGDDVELIIPFMFSVIDSQQKNSAVNLRRFNQFAAAANKRIAELEAEVKRLQPSRVDN